MIILIHVTFISFIIFFAILWYGTKFRGWWKNRYEKHWKYKKRSVWFGNSWAGQEDFETQRTGIPSIALISSIGAYIVFLLIYYLISWLT